MIARQRYVQTDLQYFVARPLWHGQAWAGTRKAMRYIPRGRPWLQVVSPNRPGSIRYIWEHVAHVGLPPHLLAHLFKAGRAGAEVGLVGCIPDHLIHPQLRGLHLEGQRRTLILTC